MKDQEGNPHLYKEKAITPTGLEKYVFVKKNSKDRFYKFQSKALLSARLMNAKCFPRKKLILQLLYVK